MYYPNCGFIICTQVSIILVRTHKICPKGTLGAGRIGLGRAAKVRQGERMLQAPADGMEVGEPLSWVYWRTPSH